MSTIVDALLNTARADTDLLVKNDERGDHSERFRDVDFVLIAPDRHKAEIIASFISDNRYGAPRIQSSPKGVVVLVTINMPVTQHVLCSVSGLFECICHLFGAKYDGWGCVLQRDV